MASISLQFRDASSGEPLVMPSTIMGQSLSLAVHLIKGSQDVYRYTKELIKELTEVSNLYQIPYKILNSSHPYNIICSVKEVVFGSKYLCLGAYLVFQASSVALQRRKIESLTEPRKKLIQQCKECHRHHYNKINDLSAEEYQKLKDQVSGLCKELIYHLREVKQENRLFSGGVSAAQDLATCKGLMELVLDEIASKEAGEEPESITGDSPYMKLSEIGFRNDDFGDIAEQIGWDSEDFSYLTLRLAEKKIFSKKDLSNVFSLNNKSDQIAALVGLLSTAGHNRGLPKAWSIRQVALTIDSAVAAIFAVSFQCFAVLALYKTPLVLLFFELVDGIYLGHYPINRKLFSYKSFASGTLMDKMAWIVFNSMPLLYWSQVTTRTLLTRGWRQIPSALYHAYTGP